MDCTLCLKRGKHNIAVTKCEQCNKAFCKLHNENHNEFMSEHLHGGYVINLVTDEVEEEKVAPSSTFDINFGDIINRGTIIGRHAKTVGLEINDTTITDREIQKYLANIQNFRGKFEIPIIINGKEYYGVNKRKKMSCRNKLKKMSCRNKRKKMSCKNKRKK